jgi:phosphatidylglycerophosphatase A
MSKGLLLDRVAFALASAGGAGFSPKAPGTAGSLVALLIWALIAPAGWLPRLLLVAAAIGFGLWAAARTLRMTGVEDDGRIVIDEVAGMWISLVGVPITPAWLISAFLLFRLLDIVKPYPANWIDRKWPGARGVMFDDVASGLYVWAILSAAVRFGVFA